MNIRYIDYRSKEADKYIESDKFLKNTYSSRRDRDQYNGEIAIDGDEVAGYVFVGDKTDKGFINSLKVYDNYRRNGIASKLLNDAIHKYGGVDLTVKKDNTIAVNMYKKRGFAEDPDYTHGNMMYMKLSKVKNESTLQEAVDPLTALGTVVLGVNAAIKIFSKIDERKRNTSYYLSAELNGKPKATYNSPEVAIVFYAYNKGIRHGDFKTIFINDSNRKALGNKVYLYKEYNSNSKLIKSGTFESLCKSYGIGIKEVDTSNADDRKKAYAKAQSLLRSKLPSNIKSKGKFYSANDEDEKEFYNDFINGISNSASLFYASLWDIDKEARTHEHEGKNNFTIWDPLSKCVKDVSKELPKGYKVTFDGGDWDDILIDIVYSNSIKESSVLQEMPILNGKDICYNKDKFDSGEINLCFITGYSGSGKSTMAHSMESKSVEVYELDDVLANKIYFSMDNLKEYGDLIYSFFKGIGNKYYYTEDDVKNGTTKEYKGDYYRDIINDFINYSIIYTKSHKNKKYIIEGVWLLEYISPEKLKDYAVYIKGTSRLISDLRAAKRDSNNYFPDKKDAIKRGKAYLKRLKRFFNKDAIIDDKIIGRYRKYFSDLEKKPLQEFSRSNIPESEFGVPSKRKFPLDSAQHIKSAIRFFNYVEPEDEAELAKRIKKKAKEFGVPIRCGKKNRLSKYISKKYVNEFMAANAIGNDAYAVINGSIKQAAYQNGFQYTEDDEYPYTKKKKAKIHKNNMMKNDFTEE